MKHPFLYIISEKNSKILLLVLFIITLIFTIILNKIPLSPNIVSFELDANSVIEHWNEIDKRWAAFSLGLDFLYIVFYSTFLGLACVYLAQSIKPRFLFSVGIILAWGQWIAAILDIIENLALTKILFGDTTNLLAFIAKWFAISKFALIIFALIYLGLIFIKNPKQVLSPMFIDKSIS